MIKSNKLIKILAASSLLTVASFSSNASTGLVTEPTSPTVENISSTRTIVATLCTYESLTGWGPWGFQRTIRREGRAICKGPIKFRDGDWTYTYALVDVEYVYN